VRLYWPVDLRLAFDALLDMDDALAAVVARATEPVLAAIKLEWWRERLEELDIGTVPAEPRLQAAAAELLPRGIRGAELAGLEDGWATLLDEELDVERLLERGARLFAIGGRLLGASDPLLSVAGRLYAYQSYRRSAQSPLHWPMEEMHLLSGHRFPKPLRPLTALAALGARDARRRLPLEREATPGRSWALIRHWLTGKI
jgi:phytoene synthase